MFVGGGNTIWSRTVTHLTPGFVSIEINRTQQTSRTNANTMTRCNEKRNVATQDHGMWQTTPGEAHCATSTIARPSLSPSTIASAVTFRPSLPATVDGGNESVKGHLRTAEADEGRKKEGNPNPSTTTTICSWLDDCCVQDSHPEQQSHRRRRRYRQHHQ